MRSIGLILLCLTLASCGSTSAPDESAQPEPRAPIAESTSVAPAALPTAVEPEPTATASSSVVYGDRFPEVLDVAARDQGDGRWRFDVTLSSPYDTPQRYADAWRVLDADDRELGVRVLFHDHANEQPFTRSETIEVPAGTTTVYVEGRDQANGWSGQRFAFSLPTP